MKMLTKHPQGRTKGAEGAQKSVGSCRVPVRPLRRRLVSISHVNARTLPRNVTQQMLTSLILELGKLRLGWVQCHLLLMVTALPPFCKHFLCTTGRAGTCWTGSCALALEAAVAPGQGGVWRQGPAWRADLDSGLQAPGLQSLNHQMAMGWGASTKAASPDAGG